MDNWINVKDRLPASLDSVLIYDPIGYYDFAVAFYSNSCWIGISRNYEFKKVTHWQPLPEPPPD